MTLTPDVDRSRPAKILTIDFSKAESIRHHASGVLRGPAPGDTRPTNAEGRLLTPKQIRARARRRAKSKQNKQLLSEAEFEALYKPLEEWDLEELSRGRPRNANGDFSGRKPRWVTREIHERAMEQFQLMIKTEMGRQGITALDTLEWVLNNDERDEKGKLIVPPSAKNQAAMFLLEHVVGKPKQHVQQDISVKLQGILGAAMVNPNEALASPDQGGEGMTLAHLPGATLPMGAIEAGESDGDEDLDWSDEG